MEILVYIYYFIIRLLIRHAGHPHLVLGLRTGVSEVIRGTGMPRQDVGGSEEITPCTTPLSVTQYIKVDHNAFWRMYPQRRLSDRTSDTKNCAVLMYAEIGKQKASSVGGYRCATTERIYVEAYKLIQFCAKKGYPEDTCKMVIRELFEKGVLISKPVIRLAGIPCEDTTTLRVETIKWLNQQTPSRMYHQHPFATECSASRTARLFGSIRQGKDSQVESLPPDTINVQDIQVRDAVDLVKSLEGDERIIVLETIGIEEVCQGGIVEVLEYVEMSDLVGYSDRVQLYGRSNHPLIDNRPVKKLSKRQYAIIKALIEAFPAGLTKQQMEDDIREGAHHEFLRLTRKDLWKDVLVRPGVQSNGSNRIL